MNEVSYEDLEWQLRMCQKVKRQLASLVDKLTHELNTAQEEVGQLKEERASIASCTAHDRRIQRESAISLAPAPVPHAGVNRKPKGNHQWQTKGS